MRFFAIQLSFLMIMVAISPTAAGAEQPLLSGKAVNPAKEGQVGVRVGAWPADTLSLAGQPPFLSAPSDEKGHFSLRLPHDGDYFVEARGEGWYAFYGRNPVRVPAAGLEDVTLGLERELSPVFEEKVALSQGIIGQVVYQGKPLPGALINVYLDPSSGFKGMGFGMAGPTQEDGLFQGELPPGTYYLVARLRRDSSAMGPLQAGDYFGYWHGNPLQIGKGEVKRIAVALHEVPEKVNDLQNLFGENSIAGQVIDAEGEPVPGMRVMLYDNPQMLDRPLYVSQPTGPDGRYTISFPYAGRYYLRARSHLGGQPSPGELVGDYTGTPDYSLTVKEGDQFKNIDIAVEEMW